MEFLPLDNKFLEIFINDMIISFNEAACDYFDEKIEVLPKSDILRSLNNKNAQSFMVILEKEIVGGAIVTIDNKTKINELDFLYVKKGFTNRKIGQFIWQNIEKTFVDTKKWKTCTPYFDKRNIHFYINKLHFHAVEFFNEFHKDPNDCENKKFEKFDGMFLFEKEINI